MTNQDKDKFSIFMKALCEAFGKESSPERTRIYWEALKDLSYEIINKNAINHLRYNKFFPAVCELRNEPNSETIIQADVELVENLCLEFIFPDFPQTGRNIVIHKLEEMKKEYLVPLVDRFGAEIVNGTNPSATRAQMLRAHKAEMEMKLLPKSEEFKELKVTETIESGLKRIGGRD